MDVLIISDSDILQPCMQLSPLYDRDEGIEEGSRNKYFCMM